MPAKPKLEWRRQASDDLAGLVDYISDDNPDAAQELKDEIEFKAAQLPEHPNHHWASEGCTRWSSEAIALCFTGKRRGWWKW